MATLEPKIIGSPNENMNATITKTCHYCRHKNIIPVEVGFNWRDMFCQKCGNYIGSLNNTYALRDNQEVRQETI